MDGGGERLECIYDMVVQQLTRIIKTYYIGFQDSFSSRLCRRKSYLGPVN